MKRRESQVRRVLLGFGNPWNRWRLYENIVLHKIRKTDHDEIKTF